ncbi:hypothetical protein A0H81_07173 [Grifola frondosa]|uniref:Uncharacterized protein n=1 Tax=Grifola frondosa TaxID=5627 RepID=A0A1C7MAF0_GRIFR|nr:hypothetical protein A0H81_07173 [Grifola frondosa]
MQSSLQTVQLPTENTTRSSPNSFSVLNLNSWNLPWISGSYHRTTFTLNRDVVGLDVRHLSSEYSMKALHLKNVQTNATVYLPTSESRIESLVFPADHITNISETPVAFTSVGNGRLGYVGDVNNEDATTNVILSMCLSPKGTPPSITSTGGTSPVHATTAGPSRQQDAHRKCTILLISLLKESWIDEVYSQLYSGLHKNAIVHEAKGIKAANKFLSASPPPDAVLVTDAAIQERKHAALLEHLVEYVRVGGRVVLCVQFSNHFEPKHAPSFFQHWGMPWDIGSYHRTTFALNPTGAPSRSPAGALPVIQHEDAALEECPERGGSVCPDGLILRRVTSIRTRPDHGRGLHEYPAVFARLGSGFLGYVGDVNGEQPTIRLVSRCAA